MPNETPKFFVDKVREQKEDGPRPHDAIISIEKGREKVGFVIGETFKKVLLPHYRTMPARVLVRFDQSNLL